MNSQESQGGKGDRFDQGLGALARCVTLYRITLGDWPETPHELGVFTRSIGQRMDWAPFHTVHLEPWGAGRLVLRYVLAPDKEGSSASGEWVWDAREEGRETIWKVTRFEGPRRRVASLCLCEIPGDYRLAV